MDVFSLFAKIGLDTSDYDNSLDKASKSTSSFGKTLKAGLTKVAKASAVAIGAVSTALGTMGKKALDSYANYEQLVGGVETLFKKSALTVQGYADRAYLTAGLSANAYMETVTSFSASLLQSLGGDTEKAADMADMAIIDMSDNANKMGTAMESIQNAYQGFAKQNYTMLDNLKLGYGGTKEEMQRLLTDAEKLSGIEYDLLSYADIVSAIHVIQDEMGITGTTAKEASSTIQGSIAAVKGQWENLLTAVAAGEDWDLGVFIGNFVEALEVAAGNILPRITKILTGVGLLVEGLAPVIAKEVPTLLGEILPSLVDSAILLVTNLLDAVVTALPTLMERLVPMALGLINTLLDNGILPQILTAAIQIINTLALGLAEAAPTLIPAAITAIVELCNALLSPDGLTLLLNAALALLQGLAEGILTALPILSKAAPEIIGTLATTLIQFIPELLPVAYNIMWAIINGLASMAPELLSNTLSMFKDVWEAIKSIDWLQLGIDVLTTVATGILNSAASLLETVSKAFAPAIDWIDSLIGDSSTWGRDLIQGMIDGIRGMISKVRNAAKDVANAIKSLLHFSRPDTGPLRDYEQWMPDMIDGLVKGIEDNKYKLRDAAEGIAADLGTAAVPATGVARASGGSNAFTINVYGAAGQSVDELAEAVSRRIQELISRKDAVFA